MTGPSEQTAAPPPIARTVPDLRARTAAWRRDGERIALVPTMGALHEGHLALVRAGRARAERVVVSIFVNPKQFGPREDFSTYPRREAADLASLAGLADLVFAPGVQEMYPDGFATTVSVSGGLTEGLEGAARPGHFSGMATVVAKLLIQCGPDIALFGEKDFQQLQVVRRMARDLDFPVAIVGHPTMRDEHGLALSSRNAYLAPEELATARRLNGVLRDVAARIGREGAEPALARGRETLAELGFVVDYLALADADTLEPLAALAPERPARLLVAARLGTVRLLDNIALP